MNDPILKLVLRIGAGILAIASLLLVAMRLYGYSVTDVQLGPETAMNILRLVFPLSVALIFGYIAIKGKIPFTSM